MAPGRAGTLMASRPISCSAAGTADRSGGASRLRGAPSVPSAPTDRPWPRASSVVPGSGCAALSARDCTATEPSSTDAVAWPDAASATPNSVPRTLVTARGVRISKRRRASVSGVTLDSTLPARISSTDCTLPVRPRRRSCRSCRSDWACTRTTVPSARRTATKLSGPTCSRAPSSRRAPCARGCAGACAPACAVALPCTNSTRAEACGCRRTGIHTVEPGCRRRGLATWLRSCSRRHWRGAAR